MGTTRRKASSSKKITPKEIERVIPTEEIIKQGWYGKISGGYIEARLHTDGSWTVHYPEEGWIACPGECKEKHKHQYIRPFTQSSLKTFDENEAMKYADAIANGREIKIITLEKGKASSK